MTTTSVPFNILAQAQTAASGTVAKSAPFAALAAAFVIATSVPMSGAAASTAARGPIRTESRLYGLGDLLRSRRRKLLDHALARLKLFETYEDDWDSLGASQPNFEALGAAMDFVTRLQFWHPVPMTTLDREGNPVVELNEDQAGLFGSVRFTSKDDVELYIQKGTLPSKFIEGTRSSHEVKNFMNAEMNISAF